MWNDRKIKTELRHTELDEAVGLPPDNHLALDNFQPAIDSDAGNGLTFMRISYSSSHVMFFIMFALFFQQISQMVKKIFKRL